MRLVADALQGAERIVAAGKADGLGGRERIDLLFLLSERDEVDAFNAQLFEDRTDCGELPPAAVDDDELGLREALLFVRSELQKAAGKHFF